MGLTDGSNGGLTAADVAAVTGNNNGFGGWGDGSFWIIVLFLFALMGNGWGNGYNRMNASHNYYDNNYASYNRGRNNGYGYDNGYSRHTATDQMINKLEMMMQDATSKDKATIQRCIEELKNQ